MRENRELVEELWDRCVRAENGLRLWVGLIPNYYSPPQGLADAARKAQHGRHKAEAPPAAVKSDPAPPAVDGDLQEPKLTVALFDRYALARQAVGRTFAQDERLRDRVEGRVAQLKRGREAAAVYEAEPALKAAIEPHGFTTKTFMDLALAIFRASARAHLDPAAAGAPSATPGTKASLSVVAANTAFAREHSQKIQSFEERLALSNTWWLPAPRSIPYGASPRPRAFGLNAISA